MPFFPKMVAALALTFSVSVVGLAHAQGSQGGSGGGDARNAGAIETNKEQQRKVGMTTPQSGTSTTTITAPNSVVGAGKPGTTGAPGEHGESAAGSTK